MHPYPLAFDSTVIYYKHVKAHIENNKVYYQENIPVSNKHTQTQRKRSVYLPFVG